MSTKKFVHLLTKFGGLACAFPSKVRTIITTVPVVDGRVTNDVSQRMVAKSKFFQHLYTHLKQVDLSSFFHNKIGSKLKPTHSPSL